MSKAWGAVSRPLLVALAVILLVGLVAGWKRLTRPPTKPDASLGQGVAEEFLDKVREGQAGAAWDETTAEFKSIEGRESFIRSSAKQPVLKEELHFVSVQNVQLNDEPRAEYIFQTADSKMVRVLIGYEGGAWKVDRLTLYNRICTAIPPTTAIRGFFRHLAPPSSGVAKKRCLIFLPGSCSIHMSPYRAAGRSARSNCVDPLIRSIA